MSGATEPDGPASRETASGESASDGPAPCEIVVVPHTHRDREWYPPFQRFRMGLVRMLDEVLDTMAADPGHRFTMDGRLAAVEDYLEIRAAPVRPALSGLEVSGDGVVLGALRERDGWLAARLVALRPAATEAVVRGRLTAARPADTLGRPIRPLDATGGVVRLPLRPFEIATLHIA